MWAGNLDIEWAAPFDMLFKKQFGRSLQIQGFYSSDYLNVSRKNKSNLEVTCKLWIFPGFPQSLMGRQSNEKI